MAATATLFELDDRIVELMDEVEVATEADVQIDEELAREIDAYLEAYRHKVDRIVGYWRWQQSIADICAREADRLTARKRATDNRVVRLKGFVMAFMTSRGIKKLEGETSDIAIQRNSTPSLVIDDLGQIPDHFFEQTIRLSRTDLRELVPQIAEGPLRCHLDAILRRSEWDLNRDAVRAALTTGELASGSRLVTGSHLRIR